MNHCLKMYADTTLYRYSRPWTNNAYFVIDLVMITFTFLIKRKRGTSYWHLKAIVEILNSVHKFIGEGKANRIEQDIVQ